MKVLRLYHSSVMSGWRERDRLLRAGGTDVTLVSPRRWNEGGADVELTDPEPWVLVSRTIGNHPYAFLHNPLPIARALWRNRYDVIDLHEEPASLVVLEMRILSWIRHRRTPIVIYGAQNIEKRFPVPFRWIERGSLRRARAAYPCNTEAGAIYRRKGFSGIVRVLPLGVETERFAPREPIASTDEPADAFRLGYVGRLEEHKGVQVVLAALAQLPPTIELMLCGDGSYRPELERLVRELGLGSRVTFAGYTDHADLPDRYRSFDAIVIPSQTRPNWVEQYGRVAVEAMASGVPVVAARSGALPDVVASAGMLVDEADHDAWARAIGDVSSNADLRRKMRDAGLDLVASYSWQAVAAAHQELYDDVLQDTR